MGKKVESFSLTEGRKTKNLFAVMVKNKGLEKWKIPQNSVLICNKQSAIENKQFAVIRKENNAFEIARVTYPNAKDVCLETCNDVLVISSEEFARMHVIGRVISCQFDV